MNRFLLFLLFVSMLVACQNEDEGVDPTPPDLPPPDIQCPPFDSFPPPVGWKHTALAVSNIQYGLKAYFSDKEEGFIYGWSGGLQRTMDGGNSWDEVGDFRQYTFYDMFFLDDRLHGFLSAKDRNGISMILKTEDGGLTWAEEPVSQNDWIRDIYFLDDLNGFGVRVRNGATTLSFAKTEDGGKNWADFAGVDPVTASSEADFHIFPDGFGYLAGTGGRIFKTLDSGENWEVVHTDLPFIRRVQFLDEMNGFISDFDNVYKTTDGGENWTLIASGQIEQFHFFTPEEGIAFKATGVNSFGDVLELCSAFASTDDGGQNWTEAESVANFYVQNLFFINNDVGFVFFNGNGEGEKLVLLERE